MECHNVGQRLLENKKYFFFKNEKNLKIKVIFLENKKKELRDL